MQDQILQELREIKELLSINQPILSLRQFCKFADISFNQGYKLTSTGRIKFYRPFGKKIYIDREDAICVLKQHPVYTKSNVVSLATNSLLTSKTNNHGNH